MQSFRWNEYFITGLAEVDQQHFELVKLVNQFGELLTQNQLSGDEVKRVFQGLQSYSVYHFEEEEQLMINAGIDPRFLAKHVKAHEDFIGKIKEMDTHISDSMVAEQLHVLSFLTEWLVYHILGMDQNMARQIESIESGCSAAQAYEDNIPVVDNATEALLSALNNLFCEVSERNKELLKLNETLESKVKQRTQALQEANEQLEELATTDLLTNLPNRRYALSHLDVLWKKANLLHKPLSCLMIDADHFKVINDTYGHDAGDQVLIHLSQQLQQALRTDDVVCRLGGDEFLVICENTDFSGAEHVAELLLHAVNELNVHVAEGIWNGSVSIGVASKQDNMQEFDELIKLADQGVYLAKQGGKNSFKSASYPRSS